MKKGKVKLKQLKATYIHMGIGFNIHAGFIFYILYHNRKHFCVFSLLPAQFVFTRGAHLSLVALPTTTASGRFRSEIEGQEN